MNPNRSLLVDLYELTMAQCYFRYKKNTCATFDLFVRQLPHNRSFLVCCGLQDILGFIASLKFSKDDIAYLRSLKLFSADFLKYLGGLRFTGDMWAFPEGTVFFPNEPVIRVTAPIIQAQLLEGFLLNTINLQTMIASKAARVVLSAGNRQLFDFSLRRTHGADASIKVARSSYIAGFAGTSNVLAGKLYGIPVSGTMAHSFVMSFKSEAESFKAYGETFPGKTILLVDTYDVRQGIRNAVQAGLALQRKGFHLSGIRLDSGDITVLSRYARRVFDSAGLALVKIVASGNLDEFKIKQLLRQGACVDSFGVGTHMGVSFDAPVLDVIYKLSEVSRPGAGFFPTMKLSKGKFTYPGRKQVFRVSDSCGRLSYDTIGLEHERLRGEALLQPVIRKGRSSYRQPSLEAIRAYTAGQLCRLPDDVKKIHGSARAYPVRISPRLARLTAHLRKRLIQKAMR